MHTRTQTKFTNIKFGIYITLQYITEHGSGPHIEQDQLFVNKES